MTSIAIYEPDDLMRSLLVEWLSRAGYRVHESAVAKPANLPVDLVIVSVHMPKDQALSVIGTVRIAHPGAPVIVLSGQFRSGLSSVGTAAQELGVARVLAKPLTCNQLMAAVQGVTGPTDSGD